MLKKINFIRTSTEQLAELEIFAAAFCTGYLSSNLSTFLVFVLEIYVAL